MTQFHKQFNLTYSSFCNILYSNSALPSFGSAQKLGTYLWHYINTKNMTFLYQLTSVFTNNDDSLTHLTWKAMGSRSSRFRNRANNVSIYPCFPCQYSSTLHPHRIYHLTCKEHWLKMLQNPIYNCNLNIIHFICHCFPTGGEHTLLYSYNKTHKYTQKETQTQIYKIMRVHTHLTTVELLIIKH